MGAGLAQTIGAVPQNLKTTKIEKGGAWNGTPYFGPGLEADSKHMKAFAKGTKIAGRAITLVRKVEENGDQVSYVCMEDIASGEKFRLAAPGQLAYLLNEHLGLVAGDLPKTGRVKLSGRGVVVTYLGKVYADSLDRDVHDFELEVIES